MNVFDKAPVVDKEAFVAPSASVIGDVQVGRGSSIWYGCVLRGKNISLIDEVLMVVSLSLPFFTMSDVYVPIVITNIVVTK